MPHRAVQVDRFVSAPADRKRVVLQIIESAGRHLALSLFRCNDPDIFDGLTRAVSRGVAIDVLVTSRAKGGKKKVERLWRNLEKTGARVHPYGDQVVKYHAKYVVADEGPAIVASLNFTRKCFNRTCDALVVTHDPAVVGSLRRIMEADRQGLPLPDVSNRLIVGPERARGQFTALLRGARTSIRLIDAKLTDPDLVTLLNERRAEGVTVEVHGSKQVAGVKSHGKILLIDDRTAVVGSLALAALSLDFRREVAIIVEEPSAVAEVKDLFRSIRTAAARTVAAPERGEPSPEAADRV
jgi:phosphatidylserine/phosphatidylglycerophosphate/cardiolipin synthase-like enzyme